MPSVVAASWVGRNYGHIFRCLWTKMQLIILQLLGRHCSLQHRFPINDNLLRCEDICDKPEKLRN